MKNIIVLLSITVLRLFRMQDLPYLNTRFRILKEIGGGGGGCFGIESMHGMRHPDYNHRDYGIAGTFGLG